MRIYLINPSNPLVSISLNRRSYWNRFRLWKPLALFVLAGLTPPPWEPTVLDENLAPIDYESMPRPDLVAITAFTSQAPRAYEIARRFRAQGVPVVMGGIHATVCPAEASRYVDSVVTGEAEPVWGEVLEDLVSGRLKPRYEGGLATMDQLVRSRQELSPRGYAFGAIQTSRGCPLNCPFCSVTPVNGARYRQRPISEVVEEFRSIPEGQVFIVDDNLIGHTRQHVERAKELFCALADADTGKSWIGQTSINVADDEELLDLAAKAGCAGLFIGFESATLESLAELGKKSEMLSGRDIAAAVGRIRRRNILVVGSFIMGLDSDHPGVGSLIAEAADRYGVDNMNVLFLTPLPGTRLFRQLKEGGRIALQDFPEDWKYYTLNYPVAQYKYLSRQQIIQEMNECNGAFYSPASIVSRLGRNLLAGRNPVYSLASNLTSRRNSRLFAEVYTTLWPEAGALDPTARQDGSQLSPIKVLEIALRQLKRLTLALRP